MSPGPLQDNYTLAAIGLIAVVTLAVCWLRRTKTRNETSKPENTVLLHQLGKGVYAPSISPFVLKLETYLRMADIPYENAYDRKMSSKGKTPWVEYNGDFVPDSAFCIDYLNKKFEMNLSSRYNRTERGIARAFVKMLEENTYWYLVLYRCIFDPERRIFRKLGLGWFILKILERKARSASWQHGLGRHSEGEVNAIIMNDLEALSNFIGGKKFLLGDTPCEEDCAVFGQLAQLVWQVPGSLVEKAINDKYMNLKSYCLRMREKYWSDWDERILDVSPSM